MTINKLEPKAFEMILSGEASEAMRLGHEKAKEHTPDDQYRDTLMLAVQIALKTTKSILMEWKKSQIHQ